MVAPVKPVPVMVRAGAMAWAAQRTSFCPEVLPEAGVIEVTTGPTNACVAAAMSSAAAARMPIPRRRILTMARAAEMTDAALPSAVLVAPDPISQLNHASDVTT